MKKNILVILILFLIMLVIILGYMNYKNYVYKQEVTDKKDNIKDNNKKTEYQIKCGIGLNDKSESYQSLIYFKEQVEKNSNGKIAMDLYHSAQLGDDREMMEAIQKGFQEMTCPSTSPIVPFVPDFSVFDLPFLFPDYESVDKVLDGPVGQELLDELSDVGIKGLVYWENGYRHLTNNIRPIKYPTDVHDLKIRTMENSTHLSTWRNLGARPTPMVFSELYSAMQQKVVDAQENPFNTIYLQNYYEVQSYITNTAHVYTPFVLMISQEFWDSIPNDLKNVIMDSAVKSREHNREITRKNDAEYLELLKEKMKVTILNSKQKAAFKKAVQPVYEEYNSENINSDLIKRVQTEIIK